MPKYYYGLPDEETYTELDPYEAAEQICDYLNLEQVEIHEYKVSKTEEPYCTFDNEFIETGKYGDCPGCPKYQPRNGKWGICGHRSYGVAATGQILLISKTGELIKRISPRKKRGIR